MVFHLIKLAKLHTHIDDEKEKSSHIDYFPLFEIETHSSISEWQMPMCVVAMLAQRALFSVHHIMECVTHKKKRKA